MRRGVVGLAALVILAGAAGAVAYSTRSDAGDEPPATADPLATVEVTRRDVVIYDETTATLGFTTSATVSSPVEGTVTSLIEEGAAVVAGTVVATVDGSPVVAMIGDVPTYRDLSTATDDGIDVRQLESNLVMLGFDPDGAIDIDETFDEATADAVTAWEDSLGLDSDGEVVAGQITYVPGELLVDSTNVAVGGGVAEGSTLLTARETARAVLVAATGTDADDDPVAITSPVAADTPVVTGTVLFEQAGYPVVAIEGDPVTTPALDRDLSAGDDGVDVRLLEGMLAAGGWDPDGAMVVDDQMDESTAAAVLRWWASVGVVADPNGVGEGGDLSSLVVPAGSFVVVPGGLVAGRALVDDGVTPPGDAVVLALTDAARAVTTTAPIGDETFALGATIEVEFPDGTVADGTVVDVGDIASSPNGVPGETPTVSISIHVGDIPASVDGFVQIPVTLRVVAEEEPDAFVVPVSALVALAEGGYALEVVSGTDTDGSPATTLIAVDAGLFSDGFVSVTGDQLSEGLTVVVPS